MKLLQIAISEVAPTAEAHLLNDVAHAGENLELAPLSGEQQLPGLIQADGSLQFERSVCVGSVPWIL